MSSSWSRIKCNTAPERMVVGKEKCNFLKIKMAKKISVASTKEQNVTFLEFFKTIY